MVGKLNFRVPKMQASWESHGCQVLETQAGERFYQTLKTQPDIPGWGGGRV